MDTDPRFLEEIPFEVTVTSLTTGLPVEVVLRPVIRAWPIPNARESHYPVVLLEVKRKRFANLPECRVEAPTGEQRDQEGNNIYIGGRVNRQFRLYSCLPHRIDYISEGVAQHLYVLFRTQNSQKTRAGNFSTHVDTNGQTGGPPTKKRARESTRFENGASTSGSFQTHRRSATTATIKSRESGSGGMFLATDVTNVDMNSSFLSKKLRRNVNASTGANSGISNSFLWTQLMNNTLNYAQAFNPPSMYNKYDFQMTLSSGDVPPLMGVSPYKQQTFLLSIDSSMDMSQLTEELNAIQNMFCSPTLSTPTALQSLFAFKDPAGISSYMSLQKPGIHTSSPVRVSGARKNRLVEVKTIDNRLEPLYPRKVFIGGLPIDVTDEEVWATFGSFGKVLIDWPRRPEHNNGRGDMYEMEMGRRNLRSVSGYVFLVFTNERSVQELVNACEFYDNKFYLQLSSPTMNDKAVQVRPWKLSDIDYFIHEGASLDHRRTVFIGGVPRPTRASDLARSLEEYYGKVSYVGIDIDPELKYPKGAARVKFATAQSFVLAISGRFVQVTHAETNKRVEIKPYVMEDQHCDECLGALCKHNYAPYYCGDASCLQYYCEACWDRMHYEMCQNRADHRPMVRTGDQTRILPRPPHHPSSHYQHRQPHSMARQDSMDSHHSGRGNNSSTISRIVNRNASSMADHQPAMKPFSAIPAAIGY